MTSIQKFHSGPLPPPEDLEHYGRVTPGGAERIFQMAEAEQAHRHKMEARVVSREYGIRFSGQAGALATVAIMAALAAFCAYVGQPLVAGVVVAITGAATVFLKYSAQRVAGADEEPNSKPKAPAKRKRGK